MQPMFDYLLTKLKRCLGFWIKAKTKDKDKARRMWLEWWEHGHGTIWAGMMYCTGKMENHQNGQVITNGGENWWPIIFLVPNDIDMHDRDRLMKLVVATYCPALAWSNSRPWTAIIYNIYWLTEDMVLALLPNINSIPVDTEGGIMVQQENGRWVLAKNAQNDKDDKDDESVTTDATDTTTTASSETGSSVTTASSWVQPTISSLGSESWVQPTISSLGSQWVHASIDGDTGSTIAASEASWSRLSLSDANTDENASTTRRSNRWTRRCDGASGSSKD